MKVKEVRSKSLSELTIELKEGRKRLQKLQFDLSTKKIKNHREIRMLKKNMARILTIISEKKFLAKEGNQNDYSEKNK
jgi:large subunit ribosomal protein L29